MRFEHKTKRAASFDFCRPQRSEDAKNKTSGPSLVNTTKSVDGAVQVKCPETGVVERFELKKHCNEFVVEYDPNETRLERYALQSAARKVLYKTEHPRGPAHSWRVGSCLRRSVNGAVTVLLSHEHKTAHYGNLQVCGSVWTCAVCAAKISEHRKNEIEQVASCHIEAGGSLYMVTYTFSHSRHDSLKKLLGDSKRVYGLNAALRRMRDSRAYKSIIKKVDQIGIIRNLEVTHGNANGWHPHVHELWILPRKLSVRVLQELKNTLFAEWLKACSKSQLGLPNRERGITIKEAQTPAEYLQKWGRERTWGIGAELTKGHIKKGRLATGRTPFDILRLYSEGQNPDYHAKLFSEYATEFFGKRQCFWSRGLKALFLIEERTDEEIAAAQEDKALVITMISRDDWRKVLKQNYEARAVILRLAETGGAEAITRYLTGLN